MTLNTSRPSIFISYARADALEFVRRIAFALEMYCDVFWDKRIQAGDFPSQLETEICNREYFIFVMSPSSKHSAWCKKELEIALREDKTIIPIRIFDGAESVDEDLKQKYTYADFHEDFEAGFRHLTIMMLKEAHSSWEHISREPDHQTVYSNIKDGLVPATITKQLIEWMVPKYSSELITGYLRNKYATMPYHISTPTSLGLKQAIQAWKQISVIENDLILLSLCEEIEELLDALFSAVYKLNDSMHKEMATTFVRLEAQLSDFLQETAAMNRNVSEVIRIQAYLPLEIADYARQLIGQYANRSRYLY